MCTFTKTFSKMIQAPKVAYYFITVKPANGKSLSVVRGLKEENIDLLWNTYEMKARGVYRELEYFNLVLLSRHWREVGEYEKRKNPKRQSTSGDFIPGRKSMRESKDIGPTLLQRMRANQQPAYEEGTDPERA
jgi:hypothetical protein